MAGRLTDSILRAGALRTSHIKPCDILSAAKNITPAATADVTAAEKRHFFTTSASFDFPSDTSLVAARPVPETETVIANA